MEIKDRIDDAKLLWSSGRMGSAFALILIAIAATSKRRYPDLADNKSFKQFILDGLPIILETPDTALSLPFFGKQIPVEDILYHELRCQLIHEGELPHKIIFTPPEIQKGMLCDKITLSEPFGMPQSWVLNMIRLVVEAPENKGMFS